MFAFQIEYGEYGQLQTGGFVSIGLMETIGTELLKMKRSIGCFSEEGLALLALFLKRKEVISSSAISDGRPAKVLPEQVQVLVHLGFLSLLYFPLSIPLLRTEKYQHFRS
jgi:hypothetical protein